MKTVHVSTQRTGGGSALDGIDGNSLVKGEFAFLMESTRGHFGIYGVTTEAQSESAPNVIVPDSNPGSFNFRLLSPIFPVFVTTGKNSTLPSYGVSIIRTTGATVHHLDKPRRGYVKTIVWETSAFPLYVRLSTAAANYAVKFQNIRSGSSKSCVRQTSNQGKQLLYPPSINLVAESTVRWHVVGTRVRARGSTELASWGSSAILAFSSST